MQPEVYFFWLVDTKNTFRILELLYSKSFEMNQQQTYKGHVFMLDGWEVHLHTIIPSLCLSWTQGPFSQIIIRMSTGWCLMGDYGTKILIFTSWHLPRSILQVVPGMFLSIVSQDPSDSKSNRLHVDNIFRFCLQILLKRSVILLKSGTSTASPRALIARGWTSINDYLRRALESELGYALMPY